MYGRDITPPPSGRISSSSGSPDSLYKSSTDSSRTLSFSPDSHHTSTAFKPLTGPIKLMIDDDSDTEWDSSFASPLQKRPPSVRKIARARSRLSDTKYSSRTPEQENIRPSQSSPVSTPPHKRMKALQLTDLITSSATPSPFLCGTKSPRIHKRFSPRASLFGNNNNNISRKVARSPAPKKPSVNPFTPNHTPNRKSQCRPSASDSGFSDDSSWLLDIGKNSDSDTSSEQKLALKEMSTSRYREEFCEECVVGSGEFGAVYKCVNKLDGCTYAIKKSREPVAGSAWERMARNEVYAHAVVGKHPNIVRYYSAWAEAGHLFIQNEFCNGGSLAEEISVHQKRHSRFTEAELKDILKQVAHGLKYIHAQQLAHMDIKPANIFIQYNPQIMQSPESGIEDDSSDNELSDKITYKIGDFGHVTSVNVGDLEEGDCRYLPKEILTEDRTNLAKADIFSLGLIIFEVATLAELPKNGAYWHSIRDGNLPFMTGYSPALNKLVKQLVDPVPANRPTSAQLTTHPELCPTAQRSRKQLARELNEERFKNQVLSEKLKAVQEQSELHITQLPAARDVRPKVRTGRLVGLKVNRSKSLTNF